MGGEQLEILGAGRVPPEPKNRSGIKEGKLTEVGFDLKRTSKGAFGEKIHWSLRKGKKGRPAANKNGNGGKPFGEQPRGKRK